ncbi:MAG: PDZ domain-containing protein, partial [Planctomycetota bacterium]|nr:PDZ domain-containing protein [Planctomycetota bacterium]
EEPPHAAEAPHAAPDKGGAKSSEADPAKTIHTLIQQLGSEQFGERERAEQELKALGRPALEPLQYASEDDDPEIRARAAGLLIEMRGRGYMGVMLQEYWDGQPFNGQFQAEDEDEGPAPAAEPKAAAHAPKPPPELIATEVQKNLNRPAEIAGIQDGDKFVSVSGQPVRGLIDLLRTVIMAGPGTRVMVVVEREGVKKTLYVDLMCNPDDHPKIDLMAEEKPAPSAGRKAPKPQVKPHPDSSE